ncbi:MAG: class I SAM-dependent rRNA methyltransferase [Clostridiales bacterium]|nr:class I SAM-dependent rRNA methyltransferase [Clostridiales bacterium]MDY5515315.1 class I SAM-dependent rRNA methyltransferase [Candidatus Ventricola sp.]
MAQENLPVVHVINGRQKKLLQGHPWVYGNEIERVEGETQDGGLVTVVDFRGRYMGTGVYNSRSLITVRLLTHRQEEITDALIAARVRAACDYRKFILRREGTDSCRLIYGEADRLPGVICDRFGGVVVLQILALGMERYTQVIADALIDCEKPDCLLLQNDDAIRRKEGMECFTKVLHGALPQEVIIHENGVKLAVDVMGGQKTGYFLDQKDNHLFLRQFCRDARVLDCFSYIGGFALNAAAAGAREVTAVDISEAAVGMIERNAALNGADIQAVCANCFDYLRAQVKAGETYDVVVLDPPAFTKAHANMANACRGYKEIALSAMRLLPPGGVLATHSCSYHMPEDVFVSTVLSAAQDLHRQVRVITLRRQDIDHPVLAGYPESHYLKSLWLQMLD